MTMSFLGNPLTNGHQYVLLTQTRDFPLDWICTKISSDDNMTLIDFHDELVMNFTANRSSIIYLIIVTFLVSLLLSLIFISLMTWSTRYHQYINNRHEDRRRRRKGNKSNSPPLPSLFVKKKEADRDDELSSPSPKPFVDVSNDEILADLQAEGLVRSPTLVDYKHEDNYAFLPGQVPAASIISGSVSGVGSGGGSISSSTATTTTGSHATMTSNPHIVMIQDHQLHPNNVLSSHHHFHTLCSHELYPNSLHCQTSELYAPTASGASSFSTLTRNNGHHNHTVHQQDIYFKTCPNHQHLQLPRQENEDEASIDSSQQQPILRTLSYPSNSNLQQSLLESGHYHHPTSSLFLTNNHNLTQNDQQEYHDHEKLPGEVMGSYSSEKEPPASSSDFKATNSSTSILDPLPILLSSPQKLFHTLGRNSSSSNNMSGKRVSTLDRNSFLLRDHHHHQDNNSSHPRSQRNSRNLVINESTPPRTVLENESHYY